MVATPYLHRIYKLIANTFSRLRENFYNMERLQVNKRSMIHKQYKSILSKSELKNIK